jgi:hypothetical protein
MEFREEQEAFPSATWERGIVAGATPPPGVRRLPEAVFLKIERLAVSETG